MASEMSGAIMSSFEDVVTRAGPPLLKLATKEAVQARVPLEHRSGCQRRKYLGNVPLRGDGTFPRPCRV
jgi:hypothetical protein